MRLTATSQYEQMCVYPRPLSVLHEVAYAKHFMLVEVLCLLSAAKQSPVSWQLLLSCLHQHYCGHLAAAT